MAAFIRWSLSIWPRFAVSQMSRICAVIAKSRCGHGTVTVLSRCGHGAAKPVDLAPVCRLPFPKRPESARSCPGHGAVTGAVTPIETKCWRGHGKVTARHSAGNSVP